MAVGLIGAVSVGATAGPASAVVPSYITPDITLPESVLAELAGSGGGAAAVGGLEASGGAGVGGAAVLSGGVSAAALIGTTAAGLYIGTEAGQQILSYLPSSWYSTSGSTLCDVQLVFNASSACATGPATTYVVNSDLGPMHPPGWTGVPEYFTSYEDLYSMHYTVVVNDSAGTSVDVTTEIWKANTRMSGEYLGVMCQYPDGTEVSATGPTFDAGVNHIVPSCPAGTSLEWLKASSGVKVTLNYVTTDNSVPVYWYPVGNPLRPPDSVADPLRHWRTAWECSDGSSGSKVSSIFHDTDASWPVLPPATCSVGVVTHSLTTKITTGLTATPTVAEWTAPAGYIAWAAANPGCVNGSCTLTLSRIDTTAGTTLACSSNPSLCVNWWDSPTKTSDFQCTYGGSVVVLSECDVYRPTYTKAAGVAVKDKTGTVVTNPAPYGDPTDQGNPIPDPTGTPAPTPNPAQDTSCPPAFTWVSLFNPWYYFKATSCALSEVLPKLFVPSTSTVAQVDAFAGDVSTRAPISYMVGGIGWINGFASGVSSGSGACVSDLEMASTTALPASFNLCTAAQLDRQTVWGGRLYLALEAALVGAGLFIAWKRIARSFGGKS